MIKGVENIIELKSNLALVEYYLTDGNQEEIDFASSLIKKGNCFVAYKIKNELRFAPSRFIGYANNSMYVHLNNSIKDGRETNPIIDKILGYKAEQIASQEKKYLHYCQQLGIIPDNRKRKYWNLDLGDDEFEVNKKLDDDFPEGKIVERKHKARERNRELVDLAKKTFIRKNGRLFCEACGFDFEKKYGDIGKNFIEAHHIIPVCEMGVGHKTNVEELIMLCSNCHRMVHRRRPWPDIDEIKNWRF
ncbi:HNH endonuclease [Bacteroidota bacterium]